MRLDLQVGALGPLQLLGAVADRKSKGVSGLVRLEATPGVVSGPGKLVATVYSLSLDGTFADVTVPAAVDQRGAGTCFVSADYLARLLDVAEGVGGALSLEVKKRKLHASAGGFSSVLDVGSDDSFPVRPGVPEGGFALPSAVLLSLLDYVGHAVCRDDGRPALTCVHLGQDGSALVGCATDGHRLARARVILPGEGHVVPDGGVCLPSGSVYAVRSLLKGCDGVRVCVSERRLHLGGCCGEGAEQSLSVPLLDSTFPNVDRVLRSDAEYLEVGVEALRSALVRGCIGSGGASGKAVSVKSTGGVLELVRRDNGDYGVPEFAETLAVVAPGCSGCAVELPAAQMLDALKPLRSETVRLSLAEPDAPVQLRGVGADSEYSVAVIPINPEKIRAVGE